MVTREYLVSYGKSGGFGLFAWEGGADFERGDRVVVRTARGVEPGTVLAPATRRQQRLLLDTPVGVLLRPATEQDRRDGDRARQVADRLFTAAQALAGEWALPVQVLDAEALLDGRQVVLQYVAEPGADLDAFAAELARRHGLAVTLESLTAPVAPGADEDAEGGCGEPGCGHGGGGCTSCGSGGGCTSCGSGGVDLREYFAHLREGLERAQKPNRTPLV